MIFSTIRALFFPFQISCMLDMCEHNRTVAEKYGTPDIVQCWKVAYLIAKSIEGSADTLDDDPFFQQVPLQKNFLESL